MIFPLTSGIFIVPLQGKQQRDRRKLREKRRSTGVVHLARYRTERDGTILKQYRTIHDNTEQYNTIQYMTIQNNTEQYRTIQYSYLSSTESTGGSTTEGDEVVEDICSETRRNTAQVLLLGDWTCTVILIYYST